VSELGETAKTPHAPTRDILAEIEAEVSHELEDDRPPQGGPVYQIVGALAGVTIGVGGALMSWNYGLGDLQKPGPGMWPFIVSVVITALSALLLLIGRGLDDSEAFSRSSLLPIAGVATFIMFAVLLPLTGFEVPALVICVVWLKFLGGETWRSTIIISVVTVAAFYLLFLYGLRIPLPHLIAF
jgi:hypothetical protein